MDPKVTRATTVALLLALTAITIFQMREIRRLRLANSNLAKEIQTLPTRKSHIGHAQATPESLPPSPAIKRPSWRDVESTDYHRFIENMRSLEMPEETIRDIVLADVNKLYEQRKREVLKGTVRDEFWKPQGRGRIVDSERINTLRALGKEKEQVIKELLSIEVPQPEFANSSGDLESEVDEQWSFLPEQKRADLTELIRKLRSELPRNPNWDSDESKAWEE